MRIHARSLTALLVAILLLAAAPGAALADTGQQTYTYGEAWTVPGTAHRVAATPFDGVWVSDPYANKVHQYGSGGSYYRSVGSTGSATGQFDEIGAIACDRWGRLYVGDRQKGAPSNARIQVFDGVGNHLETIPNVTGGAINGISVAPDGSVYVSLGTTTIKRWNRLRVNDLTYSTVNTAVGITVDGDGFLYSGSSMPLLGRTGHQIVRYNPAGTAVDYLGTEGTADGEFNMPTDVTIDPFGQIVVADMFNGRVQVFGFPDAHRSTLIGQASRRFASPSGVSAGGSRDLYVADFGSSRVQRLVTTETTVYTPIEGTNRILTAIEASKKAYPWKADTVVITTGYNWPDALGGAALAGVKKGPLLLTPKAALAPAVQDEIARLEPKKAIILGSEDAVGPAVETALNGILGAENVDRIGGNNRYETASLIASAAIGAQGSAYDGRAFVVTGRNFPDALSASPISAANGWPIYLGTPDVSAAMAQSMKAKGVKRVYIVGGAVPSSGEQALEGAFGADNVERISGIDRYWTSWLVAAWADYAAGMTFNNIAVATGENYPDALAGGVLQGTDAGILLLTPKAVFPTGTLSELGETGRRYKVCEVRWLGSTDAVSTTARNQLKAELR